MHQLLAPTLKKQRTTRNQPDNSDLYNALTKFTEVITTTISATLSASLGDIISHPIANIKKHPYTLLNPTYNL